MTDIGNGIGHVIRKKYYPIVTKIADKQMLFIDQHI